MRAHWLFLIVVVLMTDTTKSNSHRTLDSSLIDRKKKIKS